MKPATVRIGARFNGPDGSANGGYACSLIAACCGVPVTVALRQPPPLERDLSVEPRPDGGVTVHDNRRLIAEATPAAVTFTGAPFCTLATATDAMARYPGLSHHAFPHCYVCGTERHDGLGLRPGDVVAGGDVMATRWDPTSNLAGDDGLLPAEIIWAALDCPAGWATGTRTGREVVLGTMAARIDHRATCDEPLIVTAVRRGGAGRRHVAESALWAPQGQLLAVAWSVWIALDRTTEDGAAVP